MNILTVFLVVVSLTFLILLVIAVIHRQTKNSWPEWSGFGPYVVPGSNKESERGKTLWDIIKLLIAPIMLATIAFLFSDYQSKTELSMQTRRATSESLVETKRYRETSLQSYLDQMTELLLEHGLQGQDQATEPASARVLSSLARARTLTVLSELDDQRRGVVVRFLYEAGLISGQRPIVELKEAELSEVDLQDAKMEGANFFMANLPSAVLVNAKLANSNFDGADLTNADLRNADLTNASLSSTFFNGADLTDTDLRNADLTRADLRNADLSNADLSGAVLDEANLEGALITEDQLAQVASLTGATMPDGTKHE